MARSGIPLQKVQFQIKSPQGAARTAIPAADCWIYLFRMQKVVTFAHEIYANTLGKYQLISLAEHGGKDIRPPPSRRVEDWVSLLVEKRAKGKPAEMIPYWVLVSPFQLAWSRLCEPGAWSTKGYQLTDTGKFTRWAVDRRDMEYHSFDRSKGHGVHVAAISTPWHLAYAVADQYEAELRNYQARLADKDRIARRSLFAMVQALRAADNRTSGERKRPDSSTDKHLNLTKVWETEQDIKDDQHFWGRCESRASDLVRELEKPPFSPIMDDLKASDAIKDRRAHHAMVPILARLHELLGKTKTGHEYLARFAKQHEKLILWQEPRYLDFSDEEEGFVQPDMSSFKHGRKTLKSYWYFVKAYAAYVEKGKPGRMVDLVKWWAKEAYGVDLEVAVKAGQELRFERNSVRRLLDQSAKAKSKVAFFGLLDAVYLVHTTMNTVRAWKGDQYEGVKALMTALGAATSAASSGLSVVELATLGRADYQKIGKALEEAPLPGSFMTPSRISGELWDTDILRREAVDKSPKKAAMLSAGTFASRQGVKSLAGAGTGLFDMITGTWNALEEVSTGDWNAALCHGASAVGGFVVIVGFAAVFLGFPIAGPVFILAGNVLGLGGSVAAIFCNDSDLEDWVKFSYFGKMNGDVGFFARKQKREWLEGHSLVEFSKDLDLQRRALETILFKIDATCMITDDCFIVDVLCRFVVKESRLWLGLEVENRAGTVTVKHAFAPYHDFKYDPNNARVRRVFTEKDVRSVRVTVQLDIYGDQKLFHPAVPEIVQGKYEYPMPPG